MDGFDDWGVRQFFERRSREGHWKTGPYEVIVMRTDQLGRRQTRFDVEMIYKNRTESGTVVIDNELFVEGEYVYDVLEEKIRNLAYRVTVRSPKRVENKDAVYRVLLAAARRWAAA